MCQSIAQNRWMLLLTLFLSLAMMVACIPQSPPIDEVTVSVFPSEPKKRLISMEIVTQDNCDGSVEVSQTFTRDHTIQYTIEVGAGLTVNAEGEVNIEGIGLVGVGVEAASHYRVDYGRQETVSSTVTMVTPPNSHIQHTIQQFEVWETGEVLIVSGEQSQRVLYSFRRDFSIEAVAPANIGCSPVAGYPTPSPTPFVQITDESSIEPNDQLGQLEVTYPDRIRPNSSDRVDVFVSIPSSIASIDLVSVDRQPPPLHRLSGSSTVSLVQRETYQANILVSEFMAVILTSPTFQVEAIYPVRQKIPQTGELAIWAWNITAPNEISSGLLTLSFYKTIEGIPLEQLRPVWVGSIDIEVMDIPPTPTETAIPTHMLTPTFTPTITPTPTSTLSPTPTSTPTPTPSFADKARDSIAENVGTIIGGIVLTLLSAIIAPIIIERWKQKNAKRPKLPNISNLTVSGARRKIRNTDDVIVLKVWLGEEQSQPKPRKTVIAELNKRIAELDT